MDELTDKYETAFRKFNFRTDDEYVNSCVKAIAEKQKECSREDLMKLVSLLDYTSLDITDNEENILAKIEKINDFFGSNPDIPTFAGFCTYPCFAGISSQALEIEDTAVVCVSGNFPSSQACTEIKIAETAMAVHDGADEIDIVMPVGRFLSEDYEYIADEIQEIKEVCDEKVLKVILETGTLKNYDDIKKAAVLSMYSGADFIKTSTGKEKVGATPEAFYIMCRAVREYNEMTGRKVGVKAAGGINTIRDAFLYYNIANDVLGGDWMDKKDFRIGTSRLASLLLAEITGKDGVF